MTRVHWLKMTRKNWLEWRAESKNKPARYLEHRIVYCADCESRRNLTNSSGVLACSVCGSEHWMFIGVSLAARLSAHNQSSASECLAVDRYIARLEKASLQLAASASRPGP